MYEALIAYANRENQFSPNRSLGCATLYRPYRGDLFEDSHTDADTSHDEGEHDTRDSNSNDREIDSHATSLKAGGMCHRRHERNTLLICWNLMGD